MSPVKVRFRSGAMLRLLILAMALGLIPQSAPAAPEIVLQAAYRAVDCGCTVRIPGTVERVTIHSLSQAWTNEQGEKCRMLRIFYWQGETIKYNGVERVCKPGG